MKLENASIAKNGVKLGVDMQNSLFETSLL